jgi:hypothetical protein
MHKVCLSTGSSTCSDGIGNDINNLLISKKVDLVLQGHDHSYQRSKQLALNGSTCTAVVAETDNSSCVVNDGSTGNYTKGAGTVINIVGTGGFEMTQYGNIYTWDGDNKYFATYMGGNLTPRFGWVKVTVSASQLTAQFMGATNTSNYTDQYTITPPATPTATSTPPAGATATNTPVPGGTPVALATVSGNSLSTPKGIAQVGTQIWVANNATSTSTRSARPDRVRATPRKRAAALSRPCARTGPVPPLRARPSSARWCP